MAGSQRGQFEWVGGTTALDFTNTVTWAPSGLENERLNEYVDLVDWAQAAGVLSEVEAARLKTLAAASPARAEEAIGQARQLREVLHDVLLTVSSGRTPSAQVVGRLDAALAKAVSRLTLRPEGDKWVWDWRHPDDDSLRDLFHPITWAAAQLLASEERQYLKHCAADDCGWLFLDRSRNHARRWCDMKVCGNNAKARRYYHRHKEPAES